MAQAVSVVESKVETGDKRKLEELEYDAENEFELPFPAICNNPPREWNDPVDVSKPSPIGSYFHLPNGSYHIGGLPPIFQRPRYTVDVGSGLENYVPKQDASSTDDILKCVQAMKFPPRENNIRFITFRNNLNKIMSAPYAREDWTIGVRFDPVADLVYLDVEKDTDALDIKSAYAGRRFEEQCTRSLNHLLVDKKTAASTAPEDPDADYYQEEFCVVQKIRLGSHRIIMGAEIDSFDVPPEYLSKLQSSASASASSSSSSATSTPFPVTPEALAILREIPLAKLMENSIEIKSTINSRFVRMQPRFMRKLMRYWIQSFLGGVPRIFLGWRDGDLVSNSEFLETQKLPSIANQFFEKMEKEAKNFRPKSRDFALRWHANVCLNFTDRLLGFVWKRVHDEESSSASASVPSSSSSSIIPPPSSSSSPIKPTSLGNAANQFRHYRLRFAAPFSFIQLEKVARRALR